MLNFTYDQLEKVMKKKGYPFYTKDDDLNIIGVRNLINKDSNEFNDAVYFVSKNKERITVLSYKATTEGGFKPRLAPSNPKGLAIMVPGHYKGLWKLGKHKGQYTAWVQNAPVSVYRDNNKDKSLDFDPKTIETGWFGINLHRANATTISTLVENWSEGCIVLANPLDFAAALSFYQNVYLKKFKDSVSFTLLTTDDFK